MNITNKIVMLNIEERINVGSLELTIIAQVCIPDKGDIEIDFMDETEISYMGIPITNCDDWLMFKDFHLRMGIDFNKAICKEFNEVFNKEDVKRLVSKYKLK
jgi:hypothetical protein